MTNIRRFHRIHDVVFLTHVTFNRAPILIENADLLYRAIDRHREIWPFELIAWAILPDHVHMLVDIERSELSSLMRKIKLTFSEMYRRRMELDSGRVWQNRFWDHIIRDAQDMNRHIDYIHYNPVKHRMVTGPFDYEYSSAREFLSRGYYAKEWGRHIEIDMSVVHGE